jgi:hypothetical protein
LGVSFGAAVALALVRGDVGAAAEAAVSMAGAGSVAGGSVSADAEEDFGRADAPTTVFEGAIAGLGVVETGLPTGRSIQTTRPMPTSPPTETAPMSLPRVRGGRCSPDHVGIVTDAFAPDRARSSRPLEGASWASPGRFGWLASLAV